MIVLIGRRRMITTTTADDVKEGEASSTSFHEVVEVG